MLLQSANHIITFMCLSTAYMRKTFVKSVVCMEVWFSCRMLVLGK